MVKVPKMGSEGVSRDGDRSESEVRHVNTVHLAPIKIRDHGDDRGVHLRHQPALDPLPSKYGHGHHMNG